jgi:hypothetical protein
MELLKHGVIAHRKTHVPMSVHAHTALSVHTPTHGGTSTLPISQQNQLVLPKTVLLWVSGAGVECGVHRFLIEEE